MTGEAGVALAKADALAQSGLIGLAPLEFGVARSAEDLEAIFRLRAAVVIDQGWGRPRDFPSGIERDVFDDNAIQIAAWDHGQLVGTTRLVTPQPGRCLPTEAAFDLSMASRGQVIDMGRTCRAPERRDGHQKIFWGLLLKSWIEMRRRGFDQICGIFSPAVARLYRRFGLKVHVLGPARSYWGEDRQPVLVSPAETIDVVRGPCRTIAPSDPHRSCDPATALALSEAVGAEG